MFRNKSRDSVVKWGVGREKQEEDNPKVQMKEKFLCVCMCVYSFPKSLTLARFRISFQSFHHAQQLNELKEMYTWPQKD